jgi:ketosteroid isomerase-like protein
VNIIINFSLISLIIFLLNIGGWAQAAPAKPDAVETEVLRLEELGRVKALRGDTDWSGLMAEGAYMIGPDGNSATYEKTKSFPPLPLASFKISELIARNFGESVVVTGMAEIGVTGPDKKPVTFQMRYLNVWKKIGDGWKIVVSSRTGVKASMPAK